MIQVLKFVSGDEVIADVEDQETHWLMKNPVRIGLTPDGAVMVPFSPFAECDKVKIAKSHVLYVLDPEQDCKNSYNANYGSGIVTATESDLSGLRVIGPNE